MDYEKQKQFILDQIKNHDLKVILNDGLNRHLIFKNKKSIYYSFEIVTWKGSLCIKGDFGTFVFSRIDDMFQFFRSKDFVVSIGYCHEKMVAESVPDGGKKFSKELFKERVKEEVEEYIENNNKSNEIQRKILKELDLEVFYHDTEFELIQSLENFNYEGFKVDDSFITEVDFQRYSVYFIYCLYAIIWGINKYDNQF